MQALGPVRPTDPTGSAQDRQVVSLHDRVSLKLERESLDRKKSRQSDPEDGASNEALTLLSSAAEEWPRHHIAIRLPGPGGAPSAPQAETAGLTHGGQSEASERQRPVEEKESGGAERRGGGLAEAASGPAVAARASKGHFATLVAPGTPTEAASVNPSSPSGVVGNGISADMGADAEAGVRTGGIAVAPVAASGEGEVQSARGVPGLDGAVLRADATSATHFDDRKGAAMRAVEDTSTESTLPARLASVPFGHQALPDRAATQTKGNAAPAKPMRAEGGDLAARAEGAKATRSGTTELTYRFQSWGDGHAVRAQIASQGAVMLNPSSMRVNAALTSAKTEPAAATTWRIDAADASGDDDSARKRRQ